jgi:hypothetical protein
MGINSRHSLTLLESIGQRDNFSIPVPSMYNIFALSVGFSHPVIPQEYIGIVLLTLFNTLACWSFQLSVGDDSRYYSFQEGAKMLHGPDTLQK